MAGVFYVLLFAIVIGNCTVRPDHQTFRTVKDVIEQVKADFKKEVPEPFALLYQNLSIPKNRYISGYIFVDDVGVSGLRDFQLDIDYLLFDNVPNKLNFSLKNVNVYTKYVAHLPLFDTNLITMYGIGDFGFIAKNVQLQADIDLPNMALKNSKFSIESFEVVIKGFLNDKDISEKISERITELINKIIKTYPTQISALVEIQVNKMIKVGISHIRHTPFPRHFKFVEAEDPDRTLYDLVNSLTSIAEFIICQFMKKSPNPCTDHI